MNRSSDIRNTLHKTLSHIVYKWRWLLDSGDYDRLSLLCSFKNISHRLFFNRFVIGRDLSKT